ncbi:hypothetical protein MXL54_14910 [Enterobacteriaceae bacterium G50]|nr:hypothetical protein [Enterobacteriaceae bacterium G50]
MEIKKIGTELEQWAAEKGWKTITPMITAHHSGDLLESLNVQDAKEYSRRLHNNAQIIKRAFRGDTPKYRRNAEALSYAVRAAMDAELSEQAAGQLRAALANRECIEATNAVLMRKPKEIVRKETLEAIYALAGFLPGYEVKLIPAVSDAV